MKDKGERTIPDESRLQRHGNNTISAMLNWTPNQEYKLL